jgi:hypothetical protein
MSNTNPVPINPGQKKLSISTNPNIRKGTEIQYNINVFKSTNNLAPSHARLKDNKKDYRKSLLSIINLAGVGGCVSKNK